MAAAKQSFKLADIPADTYLSPSFLFDWWDGVIRHCGPEAALYNKSPDFKLGRELWVAAMFACAMRKQSSIEHWVKPVKDTAPDAIVAYFKKDDIGYGELKYSIEVTTYGKYSQSLETVLKAKLDNNYPDYTRIICYISDREQPEDINVTALRDFVGRNNPTGFEVWILGAADDPLQDGEPPLRLDCLTMQDRVDIYYNKDRHLKNLGDAFRITGKGTSKDGLVENLGRIHLQFPQR